MAEGQTTLIEADIHQLKWLLQMFISNYCRFTKGLLLCAECYATHVLEADT